MKELVIKMSVEFYNRPTYGAGIVAGTVYSLNERGHVVSEKLLPQSSAAILELVSSGLISESKAQNYNALSFADAVNNLELTLIESAARPPILCDGKPVSGCIKIDINGSLETLDIKNLDDLKKAVVKVKALMPTVRASSLMTSAYEMFRDNSLPLATGIVIGSVVTAAAYKLKH